MRFLGKRGESLALADLRMNSVCGRRRDDLKKLIHAQDAEIVALKKTVESLAFENERLARELAEDGRMEARARMDFRTIWNDKMAKLESQMATLQATVDQRVFHEDRLDTRLDSLEESQNAPLLEKLEALGVRLESLEKARTDDHSSVSTSGVARSQATHEDELHVEVPGAKSSVIDSLLDLMNDEEGLLDLQSDRA